MSNFKGDSTNYHELATGQLVTGCPSSSWVGNRLDPLPPRATQELYAIDGADGFTICVVKDKERAYAIKRAYPKSIVRKVEYTDADYEREAFDRREKRRYGF